MQPPQRFAQDGIRQLPEVSPGVEEAGAGHGDASLVLDFIFKMVRGGWLREGQLRPKAR
jgi:hypothetical protein